MITPPKKEYLQNAIFNLRQLSLIDKNGITTPLGKIVNQFGKFFHSINNKILIRIIVNMDRIILRYFATIEPSKK